MQEMSGVNIVQDDPGEHDDVPFSAQRDYTPLFTSQRDWSPLCPKCMGLFSSATFSEAVVSDDKPIQYHTTHMQLDSNTYNGCHFCRLVLITLLDNSPADESICITFQKLVSPPLPDLPENPPLEQLLISVETGPDVVSKMQFDYSIFTFEGKLSFHSRKTRADFNLKEISPNTTFQREISISTSILSGRGYSLSRCWRAVE
jgi:hypothetical protein